MEFITNRDAIIVKPKKPCQEWLSSLAKDNEQPLTLEEMRQNSNIYLIPDHDSIDQAVEDVEMNFDVFFTNELYGWWMKEDDWPQNRDAKMFHEWFDVKFHDMVHDVIEDCLEKEPMD